MKICRTDSELRIGKSHSSQQHLTWLNFGQTRNQLSCQKYASYERDKLAYGKFVTFLSTYERLDCKFSQQFHNSPLNPHTRTPKMYLSCRFFNDARMIEVEHCLAKWFGHQILTAKITEVHLVVYPSG